MYKTKVWQQKRYMEFENGTLKPLSMNLIAYNSPLHFSLTSFATPKFPDPISLIISYRSMVKLASMNWTLYNNYQQLGVVSIEVCELANLSILLCLLDLNYLFACSIASFLWPPNSNAQKFANKRWLGSGFGCPYCKLQLDCHYAFRHRTLYVRNIY